MKKKKRKIKNGGVANSTLGNAYGMGKIKAPQPSNKPGEVW